MTLEGDGSRRLRSRPLLLGLVLWVLTGLLAVALIWVLTADDRTRTSALKAHGVATMGRVTAPQPQEHNRVEYTYVVGGDTYQGLDSADNGPEGDATKLYVGEPIHVIYDAHDPNVSCYCNAATLDDYSWTNGLVFGLFISTLVTVVLTSKLTQNIAKPFKWRTKRVKAP